jgi:CBS domain-containing protein
MKVRDIVNINAHRIRPQATIREAAAQLSSAHCSDLMVVDEENTFLGVLSEGDLIRATLPNIDDLIQSGSLSGGNDQLESNAASLAGGQIDSMVIKDAVVLSLEDKLLRAASIMVSKQIRCLPVVSAGKLVGTVTRADVCVGLLK